MSEHLDPYAVGSAIHLSSRAVGEAIRIDTSALAAGLVSHGLIIDGREVANQLAQSGAINGLAEQLAPLLAEALRPADDAALLLRALWERKAYRITATDGPEPEDGVRVGGTFYPLAAHDAALTEELRAALRKAVGP